MIRFTIAFFMIGMLVFYAMATFHIDYWSRLYFIWDKGKDVIIMYSLWQLSVKKYGQVLQPVFWFTVVRLVWEFISWATGLAVNNSIVVGILFIIVSLYVFIAAIKTDGRD